MSELRFRSRLFLFPLILIGNIAHAAGSLTDNLDVECRQSKSRLICDYRVLDSEPVLAVSADYGDISLPVKEQAGYPWPDATTAILIVVDTSDPARQPVIEKNRQHIDTILAATNDHHRIGLASFDKSLQLEVPVGLSHEQISSRAMQLQATGKTTELYRSMLMAIEQLENVDAERKSIYLFSDGLAEDRAYFHQDVIKAARKSGIIINTMGYPRSVPKSVALQTLRRLSEETGGIFVEADNNFDLPTDYLAAPFQNVDNGGRVEIDLSPVMQAGNNAKGPFILSVETDLGPNRFTGSLDLPAPKPMVTKAAASPPATPPEKPAAIPPPATPQPPIQVITKSEPAPVDSWFWYGIPIALIVLILLTITTFLILVFRKEAGRDHPSDAYSDFKPFAYLIAQDESKKRYPITQTSWRIGRSKDNEMTLRDNSISRRHAEIHRDKGDVFTIIDLDSLNGIFVNNTKIHRHRLHEGDIIEIGDVCLRFTLLSPDYSLEESTLVQNTRAPLTH